jgi:hypothetical protein
VGSSYNYIKDKLETPTVADNLIKEILKKLNRIKKNPNIRSLVQDKYLASLGYRSINVIRFLYKKRNWINILKEKTIEERYVR